MPDTTPTIAFEQPAPPMLYSPASRQAFADALRARPGTWALLGQHPQSATARQFAYSIRKGLSGWVTFGQGFEAEARTMFGEHRVYARYSALSGDQS